LILKTIDFNLKIGMRKTFTLFAFAFVALGLNAQFVRSEMGNVGDSQIYRKADTTAVPDGPAGSGQNWDFSGLIASSVVGTNSYIVPSSHPQGTAFPAANMAFNPSTLVYEFYKVNADSLVVLGEKSPTNTPISYTDLGLRFSYPMALGVPVVDSVVGTYSDGFISTVTRKGEIITTFDGDGTLITPYATYPNVKRIEYLGIHADSSWLGVADADVFVKRYEWYSATQTMPVLIIHHQQLILNGGNPSNVNEIWWADDNAVAVTPATNGQFDIYPNPSQGLSKLSYQLDAASQVRVEVLNILGERVRLVVDENQAAGTHSYDIGQGLTAGVYLVHMVSDNGSTTKKLVLN
jgi:hypothetical protein